MSTFISCSYAAYKRGVMHIMKHRNRFSAIMTFQQYLITYNLEDQVLSINTCTSYTMKDA